MSWRLGRFPSLEAEIKWRFLDVFSCIMPNKLACRSLFQLTFPLRQKHHNIEPFYFLMFASTASPPLRNEPFLGTTSPLKVKFAPAIVSKPRQPTKRLDPSTHTKNSEKALIHAPVIETSSIQPTFATALPCVRIIPHANGPPNVCLCAVHLCFLQDQIAPSSIAHAFCSFLSFLSLHSRLTFFYLPQDEVWAEFTTQSGARMGHVLHQIQGLEEAYQAGSRGC